MDNEELECILIQKKATTHLVRCKFDDFALELHDFGMAAAGELYRAIKQNF